MEVEDVASTAKMVGAAGTNVCVIAGKSSVDQTFKVGCQTSPSYKENDTHLKFHEVVTGIVEPPAFKVIVQHPHSKHLRIPGQGYKI